MQDKWSLTAEIFPAGRGVGRPARVAASVSRKGFPYISGAQHYQEFNPVAQNCPDAPGRPAFHAIAGPGGRFGAAATDSCDHLELDPSANAAVLLVGQQGLHPLDVLRSEFFAPLSNGQSGTPELAIN